MKREYKRGERVIVYGTGEENGKFYKNKSGVIIDYDSYFNDYQVKFKNGIEDWLLPEHIRRPYAKRKKCIKS